MFHKQRTASWCYESSALFVSRHAFENSFIKSVTWSFGEISQLLSESCWSHLVNQSNQLLVSTGRNSHVLIMHFPKLLCLNLHRDLCKFSRGTPDMTKSLWRARTFILPVDLTVTYAKVTDNISNQVVQGQIPGQKSRLWMPKVMPRTHFSWWVREINNKVKD